MITQLKKINKPDWIALSIIFILYAVIISLSYARWGHPLIDCFRNAYVPDEILRGKILYKDIFYFYGPLIVYFHSLLFLIFGVKLQVLYSVGICITSFIVIGIYYISRQILNPLAAGVFIILFVIQNIFRPGLFQYIFPYSFEALYGTFILLGLIVCLIELIKSELKSTRLFYLSAFLISLLPLIKQDAAISGYLVFYLFIIVYLFFRKISFKEVFGPLLLPIVFPLFIYGLMLFYIPYTDLIEGLFPVAKFNSYFIQNCAGTVITLLLIYKAIKGFIVFMLALSAFAAIIYFVIYLFKRFLPKYTSFLVLAAFICVIYLFAFNYAITTHAWYVQLINLAMYRWLVLFLIGYLIVVVFRAVTKKEGPGTFEQIVILLIISGIIFLFRNPVTVSLQTMNSHYMYTALLVLIYFLYTEIPNITTKINRQYYSWSISSCLIGLSILILCNTLYVYSLNDTPIKTSRGIIYSKKFLSEPIQKSIDFALYRSSEKDKVVVFPEEVIINFLADRSSAAKYFQLLPGIMGSQSDQEKVIKQLKTAKPKLIFITTRDSSEYGKQYWGTDYDHLIFNWITQNYTLVTSIVEFIPNSRIILPYQIEVYAAVDK